MKMDKILRVNTRTNTIRMEDCSEKDKFYGGRAYIARHLLEEVNPMCDPLGRENNLIIAQGLLGDSLVTTAGRCSIGGKSPLTNGVKESNVGGLAGKRMGRLGLKAVLLEDAPEKPDTRVLLVKKDQCELVPTPELKGCVISETFRIVQEKFGKNTGIFCIGPSGEMGMAGASVATLDQTGELVRFAARGGLGAVMGVKGIKAIVFDDAGTPSPPVYDRKALVAANRELVQMLRDDPKTENRREYGTPAIISVCNALGILPTRNFSSGQFEHADAISGETIRELIIERNGEGKKGVACVQGCVIKCCNVFPDKNGKKIVGTLQYENIGLLGSNCGIGDIDKIAELNNLCNEMGVDAIETGAAIGVAMEAGVFPFGDAEGAKDLINQIGKGTFLGRIIGNGVVVTGKVLNVRRVPATKGQALPAYDPRALKGIGVTYAMSAMGADHTAGNALETAKRINPLGKEDQVEASYRLQVRAAILDSLGVCLFIRPPFVKKPELFARLVNARYGWNWTYSDVQKMGIECLNTEREFNRKAGVSDEQCDVPEFMRCEPLPPNNTVYDIPKEQLNEIWSVQLPEDMF